MGSSSEPAPAPRVLVIMDDQSPRALLRAALREAGYDAIGARDLVEALVSPADAPDRGPVRLIIVDQRVLHAGDDMLMVRLLGRHGDPATLLLGQTTQGRADGPWQRVIQRPASVGDIVNAARTLLPLLPRFAHPID
jgi:DNA-binding NtrC family response regulator